MPHRQARKTSRNNQQVWGSYGDQPPCEHLNALRCFLEQTKLEIYGEYTEQPCGWVNVYCPHCARTYEVTLQPPFATE